MSAPIPNQFHHHQLPIPASILGAIAEPDAVPAPSPSAPCTAAPARSKLPRAPLHRRCSPEQPRHPEPASLSLMTPLFHRPRHHHHGVFNPSPSRSSSATCPAPPQ
jgi:hypothetical protein